MTPPGLGADTAALSAAGAAAEEALALHQQALAVLEEGWQSETGSAATELIRRQCAQAADLVEALHGAAAELRRLQDTHGTVGALSDDDPGGDPMAGRLGDLAAPRFEAPPPVMAAAPAPLSSFPSWTPGAGSMPLGQLPNIGGTLAGLVAQIADVLSSDAGDGETGPASQDPRPSGGRPPGERSALAVPAAAETVATARASPVSDPPSSPVEMPPSLPPPESQPVQPETPAPQPGPPPAELLAGEHPPEPQESPPEVPSETRTPCEIAADELPQVGE